MNNPTWLHIDINSYFASLIQQEIPSLRGKPVGIVKDEGRTCLIATSREAKKLGIKTGCYLKDALRIYPDIAVVPAAFSHYLSATQAFQSVLYSLSPDVHIFSLDEAFVEFTPLAAHYSNSVAFAETVQQRVKDRLGEWVSCSIGISYNKFLAKMAGEVSSPDSITVITPENKDTLLATTTFKDVCGIGHRLGKKLEALGATTPYAIHFIDQTELERVFGPYWAVELRRMAAGEEPSFMSRTPRVEYMQSVGRSITCFGKPWQTPLQLTRVLYNLTSDVTNKARALKLAGRLVSIGLYGKEQRWHTHQTTGTPLTQFGEIFSLVQHQLHDFLKDPYPVIKCRVSFALLNPWDAQQPSLLPSWQKQEKIEDALWKINHKFGKHTVRSAVLFNRNQLLTPEVNGFFGDKKFYEATVY